MSSFHLAHTDAVAWLRSLPDASVDLLITDPKAAMPVLQEISQGKRGAARIMAGAALYALQRGSFKEKLDELTGEDRA